MPTTLWEPITTLAKKVWGDIPVATMGGFNSTFAMKPEITLEGRHILSIDPIDLSSATTDEMQGHHERMLNTVKALHSQKYRIVVTNRPGFAKVCPPKHCPEKAAFLNEYEEYINANFDVRQRSRYILFDEDKQVSQQMKMAGLGCSEGRAALLEDMAYFFGGTPAEPFYYPMQKWQYGVKMGRKYGAVLMHLDVPDSVEPFALHVLNYISCDYIYVLAFDFPSLFESSKRLSALAESSEKKESDAAHEVLRELRAAIREIDLGREHIIHASATLTVFQDSAAEAVKTANDISYRLRNSGLNYAIEGTTEYDAFKYLFSYDTKHAKGSMMTRHYQTKPFTALLPVSCEFKGVPQEKLTNGTGELFFNMAIEPVYVDTYKTASMHASNIGTTGSGKSVLAQYRDCYSDLVVTIEKIAEDEGSYRVSTPFFGGQYAPISLDRPFSINAFGKSIISVDTILFLEEIGHPYSDFSEKDLVLLTDYIDGTYDISTTEKIGKDQMLDDLSRLPGTDFLQYKIREAGWKEWKMHTTINRNKLMFVVGIVKTMIAGKSAEVAPEMISTLEQSVLKAYKSKPPEREMGTTEVMRALREMKQDTLASRLQTFTMDGRGGPLFDSPCALREGSVFYELRINDEELVVPAILSILYHTLKSYSHPKHFGKKKKVRLDEAWFFVKKPALASDVDEMLRTYRKKGIEVDLDSQVASDFSEGGGAVVKGQCEHNFFMFNRGPVIPELQGCFQLTDREADILRSIRPPSEYDYRFSRFYLRATYGSGSLYCVPSPEFYWLSTTKQDDKIKREKAKADEKDIYAAVKKLARL